MQHCLLSGKSMVAVAVATCLTFPVTAENIERLDVTGQRLSSAVTLASDSVTSMSPDLRDTLLRLPGVNSNGNGPLSAILQYRGLFGDRLQVNIDGAPMVGAGPNGMDPPLSNVFATPATHITLYRGITPVAVGAETIGGALDVTRDVDALFSTATEWRGSLSATYLDQGSADNYLGSLGYHTQGYYVQAYAADQQRDDIEDGNGNQIPNSFYERSAFGLLAGMRFGDHQLQGFFQDINTDETGTPALGSDIIYVDSKAYRLHYHWQDSDIGHLSLKMFGNSSQHGMNNFAFRPITPPMRSRLNTVDSLARGYSALWQSQLGQGELTAGADWETAQHESVITNPVLNNLIVHNFNDVERTSGSIFGQWQVLLDDIDVTAGIRYTQVDTDAGEVSNSMAMMNPNIALLVERFNSADRALDFSFLDATLHVNGEFAPQWQWHAAAGQKGRAPSYTELYVWLPLGISAGLADGRNYIGNLDLEHELARQIDLGVTYQTDRLTIAPRIFYQRIDDYIVGTPSTNMAANMISTMMTGRPPLQWTNADATLYGIDMLAAAMLTKSLRLEATATLVRGDRDDLDEPLYRIAPATLLTRVIWEQENWQVAVESELVANQSRVSLIQDELESAGYGVVNANVQYQFNDHVKLTAMLGNLFDKAYQPHVGSVNRIAGIQQPVGERIFAAGRTLGVQLELQF